MKKIAIVLASLLITACASTPKPVAPATPANDKPAATGEKAAPQTAPVSNDAVSAAEIAARQTTEEIQEFKQQSIYFDFDKAIVKQEFHADIQKQADFIKSHSNDTVTLEGNCDERGSSEYNLGLGSERAKAVAKDLKLMGVSETQIKIVSLGEEKPRLTCHEEKCWKENRRVDFIHELH